MRRALLVGLAMSLGACTTSCTATRPLTETNQRLSPLQLRAHLLDHDVVRVEWSTDVEVHTVRYELEKSEDGRLFQRVGVTPARGAGYYALADPRTPRWVCYRLRIVAVNGTCTFSPLLPLPTAQRKF